MTGIIPRTPRAPERSAAQAGPAAPGGLATAGLPTMIGGARAKWLTHKVRFLDTDLTRYPSPAGWACQATGSPSIFLPAAGPNWGRDARCADAGHLRFDMLKTVAPNPGDTPRKQRERTICGLQYWALASPAVRRLPGAAIPWANRRSWVRARVRAPRSCWTAALPAARWWALRPTWPTATNTRAAATKRAAGGTKHRLNTVGAPGFSGAGADRHDIAPCVATMCDALNDSMKSRKCNAAPGGVFARLAQGRVVAG